MTFRKLQKYSHRNHVMTNNIFELINFEDNLQICLLINPCFETFWHRIFFSFPCFLLFKENSNHYFFTKFVDHLFWQILAKFIEICTKSREKILVKICVIWIFSLNSKKQGLYPLQDGGDPGMTTWFQEGVGQMKKLANQSFI